MIADRTTRPRTEGLDELNRRTRAANLFECIVTVLEGSGHSIVGGERFDWEPFDTFCVPGGEWCQHANAPGKDAVLFVSSDQPTLKALGFMLKHGRNAAGDIVPLA